MNFIRDDNVILKLTVYLDWIQLLQLTKKKTGLLLINNVTHYSLYEIPFYSIASISRRVDAF